MKILRHFNPIKSTSAATVLSRFVEQYHSGVSAKENFFKIIKKTYGLNEDGAEYVWQWASESDSHPSMIHDYALQAQALGHVDLCVSNSLQLALSASRLPLA